jgi:hypothetical protein
VETVINYNEQYAQGIKIDIIINTTNTYIKLSKKKNNNINNNLFESLLRCNTLIGVSPFIIQIQMSYYKCNIRIYNKY